MKLQHKKNTIILLLILLTVGITFAIEPSQQFVSLNLNPYYRQSLSSNTNYQYNLTIQTEDGLSKVNSAIIRMKNYMTPTINYNITINEQSCNPKLFTISTTYSGSDQADISFDCTNIIKTAGTYNINLRTDKNTGSIYSFLDLTYTNKPKQELKVFGTEYEIGQTAKVWLQLLNESSNAINTGFCYIDIYKPNGTHHIEDAQMTNLNHEGLYYYDLPVPETEGVYPVIAKCYYVAISNLYYATNYLQSIGTAPDPILSKTYTEDGTFARFKEANTDGVRRIDLIFNITNLSTCVNITESLLTGISLETYMKFDSVNNDNINLYIYNYSSNTWITLPNVHLEANDFITTSNSIFLNNITKAGIYNTTNQQILIRMNDTNLADGADSNLDIDLLSFKCNQLANPTYVEVMGSSEMHVNNETQKVLDAIKNLSLSFNSELQEILISRNISTEQYINLTNQINQLQNNLTYYLNIINNKTENLTNKIDALYNLNYEMNQTITNSYNLMNLINNTLIFEFNNTNTQINNLLNNLTNQINTLNQSITEKINQSTNTIISEIQNMNQSLTYEIQYLNLSITNQINNLQNLIYAQTNLTTEQYLNITNQINNLENNINQQYNNLTQQINNIQIDITNLTTTTNQIYNLTNQINIVTLNTYNEVILLNQTIFQQFSITNQLINDIYNNLTNQLINYQNITDQQLQNLTNITITNQNLLQQIWNYLTVWITNTLLDLNQSVTNINQSVNIILNQTNATLFPATILATTDTCITDSNWIITAVVLDQNNNNYPNANCIIYTDSFGSANMTYNMNSSTYIYNNVCPSPQSWNWSITCT